MRFLANDRVVETEAWALSPALDFIRGDLGLTGTKEGCREGDCGACAVLMGERSPAPAGAASRAPNYRVPSYRALPSCLLALGELEGRHLVTIEGLASGGLSPVMKALAEANGSQCGFCSPGFVISLTAYLMSEGPLSVEGALSAIEGNLCRCTGYGSIRRAASALVERYSKLPADPAERLKALTEDGVVPPSLSAFARGEFDLDGDSEAAGAAKTALSAETAGSIVLGGGTDFLVRNPDPERGTFPSFALLDRMPELKKTGISESGGEAVLELGAALNWREFFAQSDLRALAPGIEGFEKILASPLVRERATIGGNIANASPVGDLTAMLIALGAKLRLRRSPGRSGQAAEGARELPLERFFLGYKKIDLRPPEAGAAGEIIEAILIPASGPALSFNFEKLSKRERLDIASVNSAAAFRTRESGGRILVESARISAGGVAPVPLFLAKASAFLTGRELDAKTVLEAARIAASECSPISDARGSAGYRRRLLERLVLAHFIRLFPAIKVEEAIA
jgi:xanthine dehydrogenase small subunit